MAQQQAATTPINVITVRWEHSDERYSIRHIQFFCLFASSRWNLIPSLQCLNAKTAAAIDKELMSPDGFNYSIDQLMELAGLSCAQGVYELYSGGSDAKKKVLVVCGPGSE